MEEHGPRREADIFFSSIQIFFGILAILSISYIGVQQQILATEIRAYGRDQLAVLTRIDERLNEGLQAFRRKAESPNEGPNDGGTTRR